MTPTCHIQFTMLWFVETCTHDMARITNVLNSGREWVQCFLSMNGCSPLKLCWLGANATSSQV